MYTISRTSVDVVIYHDETFTLLTTPSLMNLKAYLGIPVMEVCIMSLRPCEYVCCVNERNTYN